MDFCPPNITFFDIWVDHGISQCLMDSTTSIILALFILLFGTVQLWMYKKYAVALNNVPRSKLYYFQILISYVVIITVILKYTLLATVIHNKTLYIYQIVSGGCLVFSLCYAIYLTSIERNYCLPSVPPKGHGLVLLLFWTMLLIFANLTFINIKREDWWFHLKTKDDKIDMYLFVVYYFGSLTMFVLGLKAPGLASSRDYYGLENGASSINVNIEDERLVDENVSTWKTAWVKITALAPFMWPKKNIRLKFQVLLCVLALILGRVINVFVPVYSRLLVNSMIEKPLMFRWDYVVIFVSFKFLQGGGTGGMGLLNNSRTYLWLGIQQHITREIEIEFFRHLHRLSLRWHLSRKTGEVIPIMSRGTDSISNLINFILFQISPTLIDIIVAIIFFITSFSAVYGLIVFITMTLYIIVSIVVTEWRTKFQRAMNLANNAQRARSIDSLLNYETVKYYGGEDDEVEDYKECILKYQVAEWKSTLSLIFLNSLQNILITGGLLAGSLLCVYQVTVDQVLTVGDYTLFAAYILQLYVPLNWFGSYYRAIQKNFIDMENMFDLLKEAPDVLDEPGAPGLYITQGGVEFRNVKFGYSPERTILKDISFIVPPGHTVALVGQTGSGKSTIIRLLFRFYDPQSGDILIDNQNIRSVTQKSLRKTIGVVPQDTVLFNNTLKFNIHYGRPTASDADIIDAARNADIHERILTFPDSYETQVGERGLKLSGGEKQRIAIARTILKAPDVVLLDEATSSLDTKTERNIQAALNRVCANRTTIIVAHRLSTIIHANEILVMHEGEIIERGRHEDLLLIKDGNYASMWYQQQNKPEEQPPSPSSPSSAEC